MKHGLKRFTRCVLVAALSVSLAVPTMAATKAEVQSQIENLKNQQSELETQLASLKKNKSDTESYISELDSKIKTYLAQLEEVSAQLEQTESEISITQDNLAQAKEDEKTQYTALKARIKAMYESGDDDYLQMLLGSGDLKTMLNNQEYISKINEYDHNLLVSLQNIRDQIAAYEAQLEEQKELQEAQKEQYEVEKESLEKIVAQKEEELVILQRNILDKAAEYVKPRGVLIFSTCTVAKEENEENMMWFMNNHPFKLESIDEFVPDELKSETTSLGYLQLLPGVHGTDGFFMAKFRRK